MNAPQLQRRIEIRQASTPADLATVRRLFEEYAQSLGFSLCFQNFDQEIASLPGDYAPPSGRLLLAEVEGEAAGCVALHALPRTAAVPEELCEMKRLYLRPRFRGLGLGRRLAEQAIAEARTLGYRSMRLDTVPAIMASAVALYRLLGFREIPPHRVNPIEGALYMELEL